MSLQLAAQHLAARGRGPDTTLVHMAPSEVRALQAVALAHGGSLTLNPDTGLPEAGFLSSILPMIAGVGLTALSGGTLSPVMAGLLTGGGTALATGNLQKGLMAGLGAYGGAGLGSALAGAGASGMNAAASNAILEANPGLTAGEIGREMGTAGFVQPSIAANANPATASMTDKMMAGFKGLGNEAGRDAFMKNIGGAKGLFKSGYTAALPVMMSQSGETARPPSTGVGNPYSSEYIPGYTGAAPSMNSSERLFMDPRIRRMADGGDTGMTGQSDAYYRYLMGLAPAPAAYEPPAVYTPVGTPAASISEALAPSAQLMGGSRREPYYDNSLSGEQPIPGNWGYGFDPITGVPTGIVSALVPIANALNIYSPQQGLATFGLPGAVLGNAALMAQQTNLSQIAESNSNAGITPGGGSLQMDQGSHAEGQIDTGPIGGNGADNEDAAMGDAIAAAVAAAEANNVAEGMSSVAEGQVDVGPAASSAAPDSGSSGDDGSGPSSAGDYARGGLSSLIRHYASGGYNLGGYSDGGRLLRGPGDGVSDSIPATIADKQPARLADGEFVVPARIVSELGNGSTDAGARKLYAMLDRVQQGRAKTTGKGKVAVNSRADRYLPA